MTMSECWGFLKDGFIKVFDVERVEGQLSREERQLALKLEKEKYSTVFLCNLVFRMRVKWRGIDPLCL